MLKNHQGQQAHSCPTNETRIITAYLNQDLSFKDGKVTVQFSAGTEVLVNLAERVAFVQDYQFDVESHDFTATQ